MTKPLLLSVVDSPTHPNFSALYQRLGFEELRLDSQRKAIAAVKKRAPDFIVADFIYAFSTYYQATNISNLDVLLNTLVRYAPQTKVIVLVSKEDRERAEPLNNILPLHAILMNPVGEAQLQAALTAGS